MEHVTFSQLVQADAGRTIMELPTERRARIGGKMVPVSFCAGGLVPKDWTWVGYYADPAGDRGDEAGAGSMEIDQFRDADGALWARGFLKPGGAPMAVRVGDA